MARRKARGVGELYSRLGARIAHLRRVQGLTQEDLGRLAQVTSNYVARTEGAYHRVPLAKLEALAAALGVSVPDLFTGTPAPGAAAAAVLPALLGVLAGLAKEDQVVLLQVARRLEKAAARLRRGRAPLGPAPRRLR